MKSLWFRGLSEEDKKLLTIKLKENKLLFSQQESMVGRWLEEELSAILDDNDFNSPAYSELQAYRKGKAKAYKDLLDVIKDLTNN